FDGLDISLLVESFKEFSIGGVLLFILSTPIILVTLVMKNYVPTIIFTVVITLINVMGGSSEHRALFPWAAAGDIANHTLPSRSEEHTSELQSRFDLVCRLLLE